MTELLTLDSNVFISAYKGNEEFSKLCIDLISMLPEKFSLIEPTIVIIETYRAIGKYFGKHEGQQRARDIMEMTSTFVDLDLTFCMAAGKIAVEYGVYSADALYLTTALRYNTTLISLDVKDFIERIRKAEPNSTVYHVTEFMETLHG